MAQPGRIRARSEKGIATFTMSFLALFARGIVRQPHERRQTFAWYGDGRIRPPFLRSTARTARLSWALSDLWASDFSRPPIYTQK
jgi:hypothetical protein